MSTITQLPSSPAPVRIAIVGGGPAGLMAAEQLATTGATVTVYDAMPSVGRKFLLAGRGGLNLTHSEALEPFSSPIRPVVTRRCWRSTSWPWPWAR